jgi:phosphoglycolate phosphatase-like HAD superfamily hydrolase
MKLANLKAIAWDLDGTLLDSFYVFEKSLADALVGHRLSMPSKDKIAANFHGSLSETLKNILGLDDDQQLALVIEDFLREQDKYYLNNVDSHLFTDAIKLAQSAASKGLLQIIVSNRPSKAGKNASPEGVVAATVLADFINEVRAGDQFEYRKPDIRIISDWLDKHSIHPDELVVIGDQDVDAQLAINLGCRAILIKRHNKIKLKTSLHGSDDKIEVVESLDEIEII